MAHSLGYLLIGWKDASDYHDVLRNRPVILKTNINQQQAQLLLYRMDVWINDQQPNIIIGEGGERHQHKDGKPIITKPMPIPQQPDISFVMTDQKANRLYLTSRIIYQKLKLKMKNRNGLFSSLVGRHSSLSHSQDPMTHFYVAQQLVVFSTQYCLQNQINLIEMVERVKRELPLKTHGKENQHFALSEQTSLTEIVGFCYKLLNSANNTSNKSLIFEIPGSCMWTMRPTSNSLYTPTQFIHTPPLRISHWLTLISAVLQEKQIIIFGRDSQTVIRLCQTLFEIVRPLEWQFPYIPWLPASLSEAVSSLTPYIVGIGKSRKEFEEEYDLTGKVLVDLYSLEVICDKEVIPLPKCLSSILEQTYKCRYLKKHCLQHEFKLKQVFLLFMLKVIGRTATTIVNGVLDQSRFVRMLDNSEKEFYEEFIGKTMLFAVFKEKVEAILNNSPGYPQLKEFVTLMLIQQHQKSYSNIQRLIELRLRRAKKQFELPERIDVDKMMVHSVPKTIHAVSTKLKTCPSRVMSPHVTISLNKMYVTHRLGFRKLSK